MEKIVRIGGVELYESDAKRLHDEGKLLVTYGKIYALVERAGAVRGKVVHTAKGMTRRGRFYAMSPETVQNIFGISL